MKLSTGDRLKQIMSERNLRQVDILEMVKPYADESNVKISKTDLSQYVNNKVEPRQDKLYALAKTLNVNEAWLMGYNTEQDRLTDKERRKDLNILTMYNQLNKDRQEKVYLYTEKQLDEQTNNVIDIREYKDVNIQSKLSAGTGILDLDPEQTELISYNGFIPDNYDMAFKVSGDSMEPLFQDDEIVFVKVDSEVRNGQIGVVMINEEAYIKKIYLENKRLRLVSLNKEYDDIFANDSDDIRVIGRVII